jgi:hypothetical protein
MTRNQIEQRLKALADYELSCHQIHGMTPDRVSKELVKILLVREKLRAMLKATPK